MWPLRLCQLLVAGIQELKSSPKYLYEASSRWEPVSKQVSVSTQALHSTGNKPLPTLSARRLRTHSGGILLVQQLSEKATIPTRGSEDAAGLDLHAALPTEIAPQSRGLVSTGLAMAIPKGAYGRIAPRSGLAVEKGITIGAGVIDSDYRGEVKVLLFNHGDQPLRVHHLSLIHI